MTDLDSSLSRLEAAFQENFARSREIGASLSLYRHGEELLRLGAGKTALKDGAPWTGDTLVPVFSATKGPASACVLLALHRAGLTPDTTVRKLWPGFPIETATIGQLLSHQCGLAALDVNVDIADHDAIIAAVNRQTPRWLPPKHGYHPRMFGPLVEELVRRLTGMTLGAYWDEAVRHPLNLEFWIGLPPAEFPRVARLYPGKATAAELNTPFYKDYLTEGTFVRKAFTSPAGYLSVQEMNKPEAWTAALPALGGVGTASALAAFYQACLGTPAEGPRELFPPAVRQWMTALRSNGPDELLAKDTAFSCGFMKDPLNADGQKTRRLFGPHTEAFGHPGAGGSIGLADPVTGISFAYTMNQMELGVLPGPKTIHLLSALFAGQD